MNQQASNYFSFPIQEYLSLGYLYLLSLGIIKDSIYYYFLNIPIFSYFSLSDVLLSPIDYLINNIFIPLILILIIVTLYKTMNWRKQHAKEIPSLKRITLLTMLFLFSFYLGTGIGGGYKVAQRIKQGVLKADHQLVFQDKESINIKIVGQNSQYIFYIEPADTSITIAPIPHNIKKIILLK